MTFVVKRILSSDFYNEVKHFMCKTELLKIVMLSS